MDGRIIGRGSDGDHSMEKRAEGAGRAGDRCQRGNGGTGMWCQGQQVAGGVEKGVNGVTGPGGRRYAPVGGPACGVVAGRWG